MEIKTIRLVISQPQTSSAPSEWDFFNDECVGRTQAAITEKANAAWSLIGADKAEIEKHLSPGEKQCAYCRAKPDCPALAKMVAESVADEFPDLGESVTTADSEQPDDKARIAKLYFLLPLIKKWAEAVESKVVRMTLAGELGEAQELKVVAGKRGNKSWDDAAAIEAMMKDMRIKADQMYTMSLVSPTAAEKLLAEANPRKWKKLQEHIVQADGKPTIAHISDKKPAINVKPADDFDVVVAPVVVDDLL